MRLSDEQGQGTADSLARDVAAFLGVAHLQPRDSKQERARWKRDRKYALVPLIVTAAALFVAGIFYLLTA